VGWLPLAYPDDPTMRISHETIALRHCCVDLAALGEMTRRLEDAATAAGPDPSAIRRVLNVNGAITDGRSGGPLQGPVQQWTDELTELVVGYGFDTFLLWAEGDEQLERFALEVVPAARQQLAAETS
jgi:hypothetical protein